MKAAFAWAWSLVWAHAASGTLIRELCRHRPSGERITLGGGRSSVIPYQAPRPSKLVLGFF
ncbi:hypothetical protein [Bdellovibrio bacteriovorus]|uniref:hypothetical protein n=1 Tax=Bdellovibrio bacteriovorus TaxID=959 RepID=UPI0035A7193E